MTITNEQKITELRRLIEHFRKVYKNFITNGIVDAHLANFRMSILESMLQDYELKARIGQYSMNDYPKGKYQ